MNLLIDDVARILATPMSRRKALMRIAGVVGGVLLAGVPLKAVGNCGACTTPNVQSNCNENFTCRSCLGGGNICCRTQGNLTCCGTSHCCPPGCCNTQTGTCFTSAGCTSGAC
jgi:hypothetical protein